MKRIWRFLRNLLLLAMVVALIGGGILAFRPWMDKHDNRDKMEAQGQAQGQAQQFEDQQHQEFAKGDFAKGDSQSHLAGRSDERGNHRGESEHEGFGGGKWAMLLGSLLLLVAGWQLRKRAGRCGRWIGGLMIAVALLPLLPLALVAYVVWRIFRRRSPAPVYVAEQTYVASAVDALDEWERKTRRQLNQKEEE